MSERGPPNLFGDTRVRDGRRPWRWSLWLGVGAPLVVLFGIWTLFQGPAVWTQTAASHFHAPSGELAYDDSPTPAESAQLIRSGKYGRVLHFNRPSRGGLPIAREFNAFHAVLPDLGGWTVLFLRPRQVPNGPERLTAIKAIYFAQTPAGYDLTVEANTFTAATVVPGSRMDEVARICYVLSIPSGQRLRIYAGQPDTADDTHFTIPYVLGGQAGTIEGWVRDDTLYGIEMRDRGALLGMRAGLHPWERPNWERPSNLLRRVTDPPPGAATQPASWMPRTEKGTENGEQKMGQNRKWVRS